MLMLLPEMVHIKAGGRAVSCDYTPACIIALSGPNAQSQLGLVGCRRCRHASRRPPSWRSGVLASILDLLLRFLEFGFFRLVRLLLEHCLDARTKTDGNVTQGFQPTGVGKVFWAKQLQTVHHFPFKKQSEIQATQFDRASTQCGTSCATISAEKLCQSVRDLSALRVHAGAVLRSFRHPGASLDSRERIDNLWACHVRPWRIQSELFGELGLGGQLHHNLPKTKRGFAAVLQGIAPMPVVRGYSP